VYGATAGAITVPNTSGAEAAKDNGSPSDAVSKATADPAATAENAVQQPARRSFGTVAQHAGSTNGPPDGPRVDPARFVGRVARAFHFAQERGGTLQLRLSPPELGSLKLDLTVKEGVLNARLEAETSAARRLLLDHLPALRDRLAEQNVRVERFDVDVRRDDQSAQRNAYQQGRQDPQDQSHRDERRSAEARPASKTAHRESTPPQRAVVTVSTSSEINLVV
jgi:flagellar hook-length control protein FliK